MQCGSVRIYTSLYTIMFMSNTGRQIPSQPVSSKLLLDCRKVTPFALYPSADYLDKPQDCKRPLGIPSINDSYVWLATRIAR